ncbi:23S rRNA (uracil(1939)-C(5))-methyltransferase RlmD [Caldibacillus sp. 210928-DFI.2.22]|uniref:23S rRNA (uracil(1939)-C(5))-methyltransferase RlmD n=1 Tax=unclassified Caldibacillus TaxID=2641266 RepID=UPI001D07399E|nr:MULTISPECIES: 23S rRNA (uracil(1939)-C(5))-methyltransferase RlmD [unclassified Caldibacillus]MCB7071255.1 23S rRNA (uracil(1939)-C(5))-methyltransferase RlmD [Caldibacillus sp. 210928-DFI.2.22]MCB7074718.1 23S rRNA (uracil(1939)-C(5))-methyltransferase RlmD [Caldibacillus sp. 210928-DFI.2.18]
MSQTIPVKKNDYIDVEFVDLTHEGQGVAKIDGFPVFVPGGLPGEYAQIKILNVKKNYGYGKLIEIREKSPYRVEIPKEDMHKYGGCQLHHMSYEGQLQFKQNLVEQTLTRIGKLQDVNIHPIIGMEQPFHYRNKAQVPVGERNGRLITGFYKPRTHEIIDTDESVIHMEAINDAIKIVKEICSELGVAAYNEEAHTGVLRHIMARFGRKTDELMIVLITRTEKLPHRKEIVGKIVAALPNVKSIVHNVNPKRTNVILGEKTQVLWGQDVIYDYIGNVKFAISPRSFYQVNPVQTQVLYDKALAYAGLTGEEIVFDAYCGIGTISLFLAQQAKKVYGVEVVPDAINDAKKNADLNGNTNVEFSVGEAEVVIPNWAEEGIHADVIVVDPPRKGCDAALLKTIIEMKPKRVVYVSCNPATLARDLGILETGGYQTLEVQPVDMFPMTMHVECCVLLVKK